MTNERKNVFEQYNIIADWFFENRYKGLLEKAYLDNLIGMIGEKATVLDLGCGTGMPMMDYLLQQGLQVTGADASYRMLEIARHNLLSAELIQVDMRELSLNRQFDAIIAWDSFFHLPPEHQPAMFPIFKAHLNKGGVLMFTSGKQHGEAWGMNGGENLAHGSLDTAHYQSLLEENGFYVVEYKEDDAECGNATVWVAQLGN